MAVILCYNFDKKALGKISVLAVHCGAAVKAVDKADYSKTIASVAAGGTEDTGAGADFGERMMVLCGLDNNRAGMFLEGLRAAKLSAGVIKAFMTETNSSWSSSALYSELCAERDAMANGQKTHE